ncbi:MAG: DUF4097 domain-containing protein [Ruminococcus sp.]|nr:DUF4097 domain-containing protein [Ruminococcus sp.]
MKKFSVLCSVLGLLSLSSCGLNIYGLNNNLIFDCIQKNSETQTVDVKNIEKINIDIIVGDCNVTVSDSDKAVISANCEYRAIGEEKARKAMDNTELHCEIKDHTLYVDFIDSETHEKIADTKNSNFVNIITDVEISLPDSLNCFDVSTDVGDIDLSGLSGSFCVSNNVGDITAENLTITGKSDFSADVGDVRCEIPELSATELEFNNNVGDVDLSLGTVGESKINIKAGVGDIKLDTNGKSYEEKYSEKDTVKQEKKITVDGKCNIGMKTDVGDIKIR